MRHIFLIMTLFAFSHAINWYHDYATALQKAKLENKIFYIFIVSEDCRWCRKMEATTMVDDTIIERINANYIAVELVRGQDEYPDALQAKMVPKHYFLTPDEKKVYSVPGYWNVEDFNSILDDVDRKYKKRYQSKDK